MGNFDLIIFDMDGLMFDTERIILKAGLHVLKQHGYPADKNFLISMTGISDPRMKPYFYERFGKEFPFQNYLIDVEKTRVDFIKTEGISVKKGLIELLDYLEKKQIKKIVATSSNRNTMESLFAITGVSRYFSMAICGDEVIKGKPEPEVFIKAAQKSGVTPQKALVLEDSQNGLLAAHRAGIKAIFIKDLVQPQKEVLDTIYKQCQDLSEVISILEK